MPGTDESRPPATVSTCRHGFQGPDAVAIARSLTLTITPI